MRRVDSGDLADEGRRIREWYAATFPLVRTSRRELDAVYPIGLRISSSYLARGAWMDEAERLLEDVVAGARLERSRPSLGHTRPLALDPDLVTEGERIESWYVATFARAEAGAGPEILARIAADAIARGAHPSRVLDRLHTALANAEKAGLPEGC